MTGEDSLILVQEHDSLQQPNLSNRFFQPRSRSGSSPPGKAKDRAHSPDSSKERFKGAKQLFMSLERKKSKERKASTSPSRKGEAPPHRNAVRQEIQGAKEIQGVQSQGLEEPKRLVEERFGEGQARWGRYEQEVGVSLRQGEWPKSDKDTGYVSRYSRDKSRSRDFEDSPPTPPRPNIFVKSGKKTSEAKKDKFESKRLSRFLSRETLESDGYDHIEEFEEVEAAKARAKVKRQPSRTSLKLDIRKGRAEEEPPPTGRRGFLRREVTELDMKSYRQSGGQQEGFSKKYQPPGGPQQPLWAATRERALSPQRPRYGEAGERYHSPGERFNSPGERFHSPGERFHSPRERFHSPGERYHKPQEVPPQRYPTTKVLSPEYRRDSKLQPAENRYPSLDFRSDKRKSMYEGAGEVLSRHPEPGADYRRRSYHELSDVDKLDHQARNFQHSGRKMAPDPLGLPARMPHRMPSEPPGRGYKPLAELQRYPGLDRPNDQRAKPLAAGPYKNTLYPSGPLPRGDPRGPRSFDHPGSRPAMFRHSYAEPTQASFARVSPAPHSHGRFGLASLKPY